MGLDIMLYYGINQVKEDNNNNLHYAFIDVNS